MEFFYQCTGDPGMEPPAWYGHVQLMGDGQHCCEAEIEARGSSFHVICGRHSYGNYLCIPSLKIGAGMGRMGDRFWNLEMLTNSFPNLPRVDAISITDALVAISQKNKITV